MFRKITVALIAATLLGAPAFAQSTMRAQSGAPATAVKLTSAKPVFAKAHKVKKHKVKKVHVIKHVKHAKHMPIAKHGGHFATTKPTTPVHRN